MKLLKEIPVPLIDIVESYVIFKPNHVVVRKYF